jgi:hypothetical protein
VTLHEITRVNSFLPHLKKRYSEGEAYCYRNIEKKGLHHVLSGLSNLRWFSDVQGIKHVWCTREMCIIFLQKNLGVT